MVSGKGPGAAAESANVAPAYLPAILRVYGQSVGTALCRTGDAFWAIEYAYNQGWQLPGPMPAPYTEFADRWGNPDFTAYVQLLAQQADAALALAPAEVHQQAERAFLRVAMLEQDFWQMAFATG